MENTRRCDIYNIDVHRASFVKTLRSKKHEENLEIIPIIFFYEMNTSNLIKQKIYNSKPSRQKAREKTSEDDKQSNQQLAKKMSIAYNFTNRVLKAGSNNNSDSHHNNQIMSKLTITPNYLKLEKVYVNKKMKEMVKKIQD